MLSLTLSLRKTTLTQTSSTGYYMIDFALSFATIDQSVVCELISLPMSRHTTSHDSEHCAS